MTTDKNTPLPSPFVLLPEAAKMTNCPRSTILKYTKLGLFPPMVRLLGNRIAFIRADVDAWIETRLDASKEAAKTMKNRGIYENLNRRKDKGRNALTSQPFSQFSPITEQIDHDKL